MAVDAAQCRRLLLRNRTMTVRRRDLPSTTSRHSSIARTSCEKTQSTPIQKQQRSGSWIMAIDQGLRQAGHCHTDSTASGQP